MLNLLLAMFLAAPVEAVPGPAVPVQAEPAPRRVLLPDWERMLGDAQSDRIEKRESAWRELDRAGVAAVPMLERLAHGKPFVRRQALDRLKSLVRSTDPRLYRPAEAALHRLAGSDDAELSEAAGWIFKRLARLAEERLLAKGLILDHEELFGGGVGWNATLSSDWTGHGSDLAELRHLEGPVEFFGGFFGTTDGACIRGLCHVPRLQKMFIGNGEFADPDFADLANLRNLKALSLNFVPLTDRGLRGLSELKQIEELYLRELNIGDETLLRLGGPGRARISIFILPETNVTDVGLGILVGKPAPYELDLSGTGVTDAGLARLDFSQHGTLWIKLARTAATGSWMRALPAGELEITELDLSDTPLADASLAHLRGKEIEKLILSGTQVTGRGLAHLRHLADSSGLDLSRSGVHDDDLKELPAIPGLWAVKLSDTAITDAGLKHLGRVETLGRLEVNGTRIGDAGLKHLGRCPRLEWLHAAGTPVTGAALRHLAELPLEQLDLSRTEVGDEALRAIGRLSKLRVLKLSGTKVTDAGLRHLAGLNELRVLELADTKVSGAGLEKLTGLDKLYALNLSGTRVTDAGLKQFLGFQELYEVHLTRTRVTPAAIRDLFAQLQKSETRMSLHVTPSAGFKQLETELDAAETIGSLYLDDGEPVDSPLGDLLLDALKKVLNPLRFSSP